MNTQAIEQEIQDKGLTAPRVTPADVEANIASEHYFTAAQGHLQCAIDEERDDDQVPPEALGLLTFCVLVLKNGYTCSGKSACVSPENFNAETGRKVARAKAVDDVYAVMGYALKERMASSDA